MTVTVDIGGLVTGFHSRFLTRDALWLFHSSEYKEGWSNELYIYYLMKGYWKKTLRRSKAQDLGRHCSMTGIVKHSTTKIKDDSWNYSKDFRTCISCVKPRLHNIYLLYKKYTSQQDTRSKFTYYVVSFWQSVGGPTGSSGMFWQRYIFHISNTRSSIQLVSDIRSYIQVTVYDCWQS